MYISLNHKTTFLRLALIPLASSTASGAILVGNLSEPYRSATPIANPEYWSAQSFVVDTQSYPLNWIEALVGEGFGGPDVVAELRIADESGEMVQGPAGLLTNFVAPDMAGPRSNRLFSPVSPVTLQASTKYWFVMGCSNTGGFDWGYIDSNGQEGTGSISDFADSSTGGVDWIYRGIDFPYFMQVNVGETGLEWNFDGDGDWSLATNWLGGPPNAVGAAANFGSAISDPRTVTVDLPKTVGEINFTNFTKYTLAGPGVITIETATGPGVIKVAQGEHQIDAPLQLAVDTQIRVMPMNFGLTITDLQPATVAINKMGPGKLTVNQVRTTALSIDAGTVTIMTNGTNTGASRVDTLTITGGATPGSTLDLNDNDLVVTNSSYADITSAIAHARNGGAWGRRGITSSAARDATPKNQTLGTLTGTQYLSLGSTTFDDFEITAADTLVKYTFYGDTDFNGLVDFDDYSRTDNGFNNGGTDWFHGDFDYNGIVDFDDYSVIDMAFNTQTGTLRRAMEYLEGSDRSDKGMNTPSLQLVQRHFDQFGDAYASSFLNAVPEPASCSLAALVFTSMMSRRRHPERQRGIWG
ncbi:MAG: hypothetical protein H7Z14_07825 [Anaerolineae bacterium]|nr:hypothetical protein [Phycisphaerae bacterium]